MFVYSVYLSIYLYSHFQGSFTPFFFNWLISSFYGSFAFALHIRKVALSTHPHAPSI